MKNLLILGVILLFQWVPLYSAAQGYTPVTSPYAMPTPATPPVGGAEASFVQLLAPLLNPMGQVTSTPIQGVLDKQSGALKLNWPSGEVSFSQLQSILNQVPGINNLQLQFPNQQNLMLSPAELMNLYQHYVSDARGLGFGSGGTTLPELVFSSLASHYGLNGNALAMVPVSQVGEGLGTTLEPMLREMRYQQLDLGAWMPEWLKSAWLTVYNFMEPYYYAVANWVGSLF